MSNFSFNDKRKEYCNYLNYKTTWGVTRTVEFQEVRGRPGGVLSNVKVEVRYIEIELLIDSKKTQLSFNETIDDLVEWLTTDTPRPMIFDREPDKVYYAMLNEGIDPSYFVNFGTGKVKMICLDPYKYSITQNENTAISDQVTVVNNGNEKAPLFVEATALEPSTYYMITNQDNDYFMIGDDEVNKTQIDYAPRLIDSELRVFTGWNKLEGGVIQDNFLGGTLGGNYGVGKSGESFDILSYPAGNEWIGAGAKRSLTRAVNNYQVTFKAIILQGNNGLGRCGCFIYDTDNRLIASLGYENRAENRKYGHVVVSLFNQNGDQVRIYDGANTQLIQGTKRMAVYITLRKIGKNYTVKTWKFDEDKDRLRTRPIEVNQILFVDEGNFYQRPIGSIALASFKYANKNQMIMNPIGIYSYEIKDRPSGVNDMIIQPGDVIKIDMQYKNVLLNDEPFLHQKTFGSDFFDVDVGASELIIYPEEKFNTKVTWRDKYK